MEYTARLEVARMKRMPMFMLMRGYGMGIGIHIVRARVKASVGAIMNKNGDDVKGRRGSLTKSFTASANGCRSPYGPTTLGPLRSCM